MAIILFISPPLSTNLAPQYFIFFDHSFFSLPLVATTIIFSSLIPCLDHVNMISYFDFRNLMMS